jgi:hypothetical protein
MIRYFLFSLTTILAIQLNAQNIKISNIGFPNEPSIMMDPLQPAHLIAAANINNYYVSRDTGRTWSTHTLHSSYGVWGDPVIGVDTQSHFYFFHLSNPSFGSWIDRIVCQKTTDLGTNWNDGTFTGLNGSKAQDKHWCAIDRNDNTIYLTWTQFDVYGSKASTDSSLILFSKSTDAGLTWTPAVRINKDAGDCIDSDNTVEGAVPAIGPNGEVYVSWAGPKGIVFDRSLDKGNSWMPEEIPVNPMPTGWDYKVPGIYRANGLPVTGCDLSNGPHHGTIYVNWSDQRNGENDTDIWLSKSTDGGDTWSSPIRVNDDGPGNQQFFTWMTIDQTTGFLYFVFYDRRHYKDESTDVFMAVSTDGGQTFINKRISESPFRPNSGVFFGDYTNVVAHQGIVRPIWTRLDQGELSIWTHLTDHTELVTATKNPPEENAYDFENYPNPSSNEIYISYKLHTKSMVNLSILDTSGSVVAKIINNEKKGYGKYVEKIDPVKLGLPSGAYVLRLEVDGKVETLKQIIVR